MQRGRERSGMGTLLKLNSELVKVEEECVEQTAARLPGPTPQQGAGQGGVGQEQPGGSYV